ncbi:hypothetical protein A0H81_06654 [Grifola frondosa]|uniref:Uncharacterized protein n=1 Tax=Grifola frondosa TaxID=5627 RepID=A0A1C7M9V3_GRIFR|nr:hypothetical protein A0H81_06654 [Grifola frondosa]
MNIRSPTTLRGVLAVVLRCQPRHSVLHRYASTTDVSKKQIRESWQGAHEAFKIAEAIKPAEHKLQSGDSGKASDSHKKARVYDVSKPVEVMEMERIELWHVSNEMVRDEIWLHVWDQQDAPNEEFKREA